MSLYTIADMSGNITGPYNDLASAQAAALAFSNAYQLANPTLGQKNSSNYYVCYKTNITNRSTHGVTLSTTMELTDNSWFIEPLTPP
jgi:hypothetical protein